MFGIRANVVQSAGSCRNYRLVGLQQSSSVRSRCVLQLQWHELSSEYLTRLEYGGRLSERQMRLDFRKLR